MNSRTLLMFSAISGFFYVAFGAFATHSLGPHLSPQHWEYIQLAMRYQIVHTLLMVGLAAILMRKTVLWFYWAGIFFTAGILLFSGSLYCMALTQARLLAYFTPVGGFSFLIGWALIFIGALRLRAPAYRHE
ncbi:DUF423 domain-containing protein [Proteus myxofaciens]|uniref:DUF423 domain-containing protein n=1 Tax=Proteus myxofaciens ATCC 19692 TaxID=1354337 RepID=A0A198GCM3_9GAMM|nr:DUF423 domain-containing protein [Proteus myxofaciens]OAT34539.1 hypothetical protein M983_1119 [Proteus myxofaciens ATCC 19692]